jgi:predicted component of type VI protein secretion system
MQHAANTRQEASAASVAITACLHLQRGSSSQATMFLEDVPGGTSITVGADPDCDWQIRAACVPAHALSVLLLSGNLFVRSTCEGDVLLDGRPLGDNWVAVQSGARLDIGLAQLVVALGAAHSAFEGPTLGTLSYTEAELPLPLATARQHSLSRATRLGIPVWSAGASQDAPAWSAGGSERAPARSAGASERGGTLAAAAARIEAQAPTPRAATLRMEPMDARDSVAPGRHSRGFAPSLLGEDQRSSSGVWPYVLAGLVTLVAYAGWVMVLDRF